VILRRLDYCNSVSTAVNCRSTEHWTSSPEHWLRLFDHSYAVHQMKITGRSVASAIQKPPSDWKRPKGRPRHTWLRATEADLKPLNIGLSSAWKKATSRETWRSVVDTATLKKSTPWEEEEEEHYSSWACYHMTILFWHWWISIVKSVIYHSQFNLAFLNHDGHGAHWSVASQRQSRLVS